MKTLFTHGKIYTMEKDEAYDAMRVADGRIVEVGNGLLPQAEETVMDLGGQAVLPAFIDAHSHITSVAMAMLQVNLRGCTSIAEIQQRLASY